MTNIPTDLVTFAQMAAHMGVGPTSVYQRVARFTKLGYVTVYVADGRQQFSKAQYLAAAEMTSKRASDREPRLSPAPTVLTAAGQLPPHPPSPFAAIDAARAAARPPASEPAHEPPQTQAGATLRKLTAEARLKELDYARKAALVIDVDAVREATDRVAEILVRELDRLPTAADTIGIAHTEGGLAGLRAELVTVARQIRGKMAVALRAVSGPRVGSPEPEPGRTWAEAEAEQEDASEDD